MTRKLVHPRYPVEYWLIELIYPGITGTAQYPLLWLSPLLGRFPPLLSIGYPQLYQQAAYVLDLFREVGVNDDLTLHLLTRVDDRGVIATPELRSDGRIGDAEILT